MPMCTNLWTNDSCPSLPRGCDWKVELSVVSVSSSFTTLSEYQNTIILGSTLNYYTARMPASKLNLVHDWLTFNWLTDCWLLTAHCTLHTAHCTLCFRLSIKSSVTIYINKKYYRMWLRIWSIHGRPEPELSELSAALICFSAIGGRWEQLIVVFVYFTVCT